MADREPARAVWPGLNIRFPPATDLLQDLILAELDDFQPAAIQEDDDGGLRVFFPSTGLRDRARETLLGRFERRGAVIESVDVPDENWAVRSQAGLRAVSAGRIVITPPWEVPATEREGADPPIVIVIRPSTGFGTGHHATTRLALMALQSIDLRGRPVLDLGTGSGVLAIAAVRLGACDPDALAAAAENVALNELVDRITLTHRDFRELRGKAPVVIANLTGALIQAQAERLMSPVEPGGFLVVTGFLETETSVVPALEAGLSLVRLDGEEEWLCGIFRRD